MAVSLPRDINACTSRHITSVPGVDKRLADNIVKYRQSHGLFSHVDELWRVKGMSRTKFQLLRRHFRIPNQKPLMVGSKLPYAKLSLDDSMMDIVCCGKSVQNSPAPQPSTETVQNIKRVEIIHKKKTEAPEQTENRAAKRDQRFSKHKSRDNGRSQACNCAANNGITRIQSAIEKDRDLTDEQKFHENLELLQAFAPRRQAWTDAADQKPSVTLQTSKSGNNLKFSCTIDKRMLHNQTSMAFQIEDATLGVKGTDVALDTNVATQASRGRSAPTDGRVNASDAVPGHSGASGGDNAVTQTEVHLGLPLIGRGVDHASLVSGANESSGQCELTPENLSILERQHALSESGKRRLIEAWVTDVNRERNVGELLQARQRISTSKHVNDSNLSCNLKTSADLRARLSKSPSHSPTRSPTRMKTFISPARASVLAKSAAVRSKSDHQKATASVKPGPSLARKPTDNAAYSYLQRSSKQDSVIVFSQGDKIARPPTKTGNNPETPVNKTQASRHNHAVGEIRKTVSTKDAVRMQTLAEQHCMRRQLKHTLNARKKSHPYTHHRSAGSRRQRGHTAYNPPSRQWGFCQIM